MTDYQLEFGIPRGPQGPQGPVGPGGPAGQQGPAPVFGSPMTGSPGTDVQMSGAGTAGSPYILTIPRGADGSSASVHLGDSSTIGVDGSGTTADPYTFNYLGETFDVVTTSDGGGSTQIGTCKLYFKPAVISLDFSSSATFDNVAASYIYDVSVVVPSGAASTMPVNGTQVIYTDHLRWRGAEIASVQRGGPVAPSSLGPDSSFDVSCSATATSVSSGRANFFSTTSAGSKTVTFLDETYPVTGTTTGMPDGHYTVTGSVKVRALSRKLGSNYYPSFYLDRNLVLASEGNFSTFDIHQKGSTSSTYDNTTSYVHNITLDINVSNGTVTGTYKFQPGSAEVRMKFGIIQIGTAGTGTFYAAVMPELSEGALIIS